MSLQAQLIEDSFALVAPRAAELADRFYQKLFLATPQLRAMFPRDLSDQKKKLLAALTLVVQNVRVPDQLLKPLQQMGIRHAGYGTQPKHYPLVGQVLLETLAEFAGDKWSPQLEAAWAEAYGLISKIMIDAAATAQRRAA